MNFSKYLHVLLVLFFASSVTAYTLFCENTSNGLMASDGIAYITTVTCESHEVASYTVTARLVPPQTGSYNATYYLKNADGTFAKITPETDITFTKVKKPEFWVAQVDLYAETTTTSTTIVFDNLEFNYTSPEHDIIDPIATKLNYISATTDTLTMFKLNSHLHPALNDQTSVEDLQKVADHIKSSKSVALHSGYSLPALCFENLYNKVKDMGIEDLVIKCLTSSRKTDHTTMANFVTTFIKQVDTEGNLKIPLTERDFEVLTYQIVFHADYNLLSELKWPEDSPEDHRLSTKIHYTIRNFVIQDIPSAIYAVLRSFGTREFIYYAEVKGSEGETIPIDIISMSKTRWHNIIQSVSINPEYNCAQISSFYHLDTMFKGAYNVTNRHNAVAPVTGVLDWVLELETLDAEVASLCDMPRTYGHAMGYFLRDVKPVEFTPEIKTKVYSALRSGATIRALNKTKAIYDVTSDNFKALPAKYLALVERALIATTTKTTFEYAGDALTALAEVVGPSKKDISNFFTEAVLNSQIIESLADLEGEDYQLRFGVTLMNQLNVSPCSVLDIISDEAVKHVANVVCTCKNTVKFTETDATCEAADLSAGAITGIAVGVVVVVAAIGGIASFFFIKKKKSNASSSASTQL